MRRNIFRVIMIAWMIMIFVFSSRTGTESTNDSYKVGMTIGKIFVPTFSSMSEERQEEFAKMIDMPIRKTAHAMEYAVLGILCVGGFFVWREEVRWEAEHTVAIKISRVYTKRTVLIPWLIAVVYAMTDEIHQLFVPGRSGKVLDVLIDSAGALFGVSIALFMAGYGIRRKMLKDK